MRLGENCRRVSEKFVWPEVVEEMFEAAYRAALDNGEKRFPADAIQTQLIAALRRSVPEESVG
jgi:hypothetical protein